MIARAFVLVAALSGCESVPPINFDTHPDGAPVDDSGNDGATEASTDGGDAGNGCPDAGPGTFCCGAIPCLGPDCAATCTKCENQCTGPKQICCPRNPGRVDCQAFGMGC